MQGSHVTLELSPLKELSCCLKCVLLFLSFFTSTVGDKTKISNNRDIEDDFGWCATALASLLTLACWFLKKGLRLLLSRCRTLAIGNC